MFVEILLPQDCSSHSHYNELSCADRSKYALSHSPKPTEDYRFLHITNNSANFGVDIESTASS